MINDKRMKKQFCFKIPKESEDKFYLLFDKLKEKSPTGELPESGVLRLIFEVGMDKLLKMEE